ncbi:MAG: hypothetical protein RL318_3138 [Fibrobacterota bacterium]|jgi:hypothetical protein
MTYALIFGAALLVLVALFVAGLYIALQRRSQDEQTSQIHNSGVYRVRNNPRDAIRLNKPADREVHAHLLSRNLPPAKADAMLELWNRQIEENLKTIEECDFQEIRTFHYEVPAGDPLGEKFYAGVYVTRDQLSVHPELIPPFRPGCRVMLRARNAWDAGDWRPMLPGQDGRYPTPDWRDILVQAD